MYEPRLSFDAVEAAPGLSRGKLSGGALTGESGASGVAPTEDAADEDCRLGVDGPDLLCGADSDDPPVPIRSLKCSLDLRSDRAGFSAAACAGPVDETLRPKRPPDSKFGVDLASRPDEPRLPSSPLSLLLPLLVEPPVTAAPMTEVARCSMATVLTDAERGFVSLAEPALNASVDLAGEA